MTTISIIGAGNMASAIGALALKGGNAVEVTGRDAAKAAALAEALGDGATTGTWGAAPAGDIVILAVLFASAVPIVSEYGEALADKIVVDITNPFNADATGLAIPARHLRRADGRRGRPRQHPRRKGVQHPLPRRPGRGRPAGCVHGRR